MIYEEQGVSDGASEGIFDSVPACEIREFLSHLRVEADGERQVVDLGNLNHRIIPCESLGMPMSQNVD
jgi:hypothetical protein